MSVTQEQYVKTITNDIKKKLPKDAQKFFEDNKNKYLPGMLTAVDYAKMSAEEKEKIDQLAATAREHAKKMEEAEKAGVGIAEDVVKKIKKDYEKAHA